MATSICNHLVCFAAASMLFVACSDDRVLDDDIADDMSEESGNLDEVGETEGEASGSPPEFIAPLGEGMVVDLSVDPCIKVEVVVDDPDNDEVIVSTSPAVEGATMAVASDGSAFRWTWCPSDAQAQAGELTVTFVADDGTHEPVLKELLIQLRR